MTGGGVGIGVPIGGGTVDQAYAASAALTDVATVKLMWSSRVTTAASGNLNTQVASISTEVLAAARRAGFF